MPCRAAAAFGAPFLFPAADAELLVELGQPGGLFGDRGFRLGQRGLKIALLLQQDRTAFARSC